MMRISTSSPLNDEAQSWPRGRTWSPKQKNSVEHSVKDNLWKTRYQIHSLPLDKQPQMSLRLILTTNQENRGGRRGRRASARDCAEGHMLHYLSRGELNCYLRFAVST